jgi:glutamate carboxypeptidase
MAGHVPLTVDGLGPRGGGAHNPDEFVLRDSLHSRAQVALAVVAALASTKRPEG